MKKSLLVSRNVLIVDADLANMIGINKAVILQQIHYWTEKNEELGRNFHDGYYWVYNTADAWNKQFKWMGLRTLNRAIKELENDGYIVTGVYNKVKFDRTKWYRIDYDKFNELLPLCQNGKMGSANMAQPIPETISETHNGNNGAIAVGDSSNNVSMSVPRVHRFDETIAEFIDWYFNLYSQIKGIPHPMLKSEQMIRVHDTLKSFCYENDVDMIALKEMASNFFAVSTSDHNINHFATPGILTNRFYETQI